jgi:Uma2 family endonuclease
LSRLLEALLGSFGVAGYEMAYRPLAEFDLRVADVAVASWERYRRTDPADNLRGAPELVIEVKSPANSKKQLRELAALCLTNGGQEFWVVDADQRTVSVIRSEGSAELYSAGSSIPLAAFGGGELRVDEIFG